MSSQPITMPTPPPTPLPGGGGIPGSYQNAYNTAYYKSRPPELQPFYYGRPGAEPGTPLTADEITALADDLADRHIDFDQEVDYWGNDPYGTNFQRTQVYGYTRVPVGTGNLPEPPVVVTPANLVGPAVPGVYIAVSVDIANYPPYKA